MQMSASIIVSVKLKFLQVGAHLRHTTKQEAPKSNNKCGTRRPHSGRHIGIQFLNCKIWGDAFAALTSFTKSSVK